MSWLVATPPQQELRQSSGFRSKTSFSVKPNPDLATHSLAWLRKADPNPPIYVGDTVEVELWLWRVENTLGVLRFTDGLPLQDLGDPEVAALFDSEHPEYGTYPFAYVLSPEEAIVFGTSGDVLTGVNAQKGVSLALDTTTHKNNIITTAAPNGTVTEISAGGVLFVEGSSVSALSAKQFVRLGSLLYLHLGDARLYPNELAATAVVDVTLPAERIGEVFVATTDEPELFSKTVGFNNATHTANASEYTVTNYDTFLPMRES